MASGYSEVVEVVDELFSGGVVEALSDSFCLFPAESCDGEDWSALSEEEGEYLEGFSFGLLGGD